MKLDLQKILNNNRAVMLISFILAIVCWFLVALTVDTETVLEVSDVPVNMDVQVEALSNVGLHTIDSDNLMVDVNVRGDRVVVGGIDKEDINIIADLSNVTGPGTVQVSLTAVNASGEEFDIIEIFPSVVSVKFDRLLTVTKPIEVNLNGLSVEEGFIVEPETVTPDSVTISGPEIDVSKIDRCVVDVDVNEKLQSPAVYRSDIRFLDSEGNEVDTEFIESDAQTAEVVIPVKQLVELPLTVDFINIPTGFPIEELSYTLSNESMMVAIIPDTVSRYSEISLGHIDIKQLDFSENYVFQVELPSGFTNVDNIETVAVEFDEVNMGEMSFTLSDFTIKNRPTDYDVSIATTRIPNVRFIGDNTLLERLTSGDIVAEIDLSNQNIDEGQFSVPLDIYVPTRGLVWAVGDYSVIITVSQR